MTPDSIALVYVSRASPALTALPAAAQQRALQALQILAFQNNQRLGIRGFLVHSESHFVQWLEGPKTEVLHLYSSIQRDPRHTDLRCLFQGTSTGMLNEWSMCLLARPDADLTLKPFLQLLLDPSSASQWMGSPTAIMRGLLKPSSKRFGEPPPKRIGLFGRTTLWTSSLLTNLSRLWDRPLSRSRLMLGEQLDGGATLEYLDVQQPAFGALRLVNYSGDIARHDLMHVLAEQLDVAVVFLSQAEWEDQKAYFLACVAQLGDDKAATPMVCVFSRRAASHRADLEALCRQLGRPIQVEVASLADSDAIWESIERLLLQQALPQAETNAALTPDMGAIAPEAVEPTPSVAATQERLSTAAADWLGLVAAIDGVAAVALAQFSSEDRFTGWLQSVAPSLSDGVGTDGDRAWTQRLQSLMDSFCALRVRDVAVEQCLMRTDQRLFLAMALPGSGGWVMALETLPGAVNEMLLMTALRAHASNFPLASDAL